jgi:hypothetical protein
VRFFESLQQEQLARLSTTSAAAVALLAVAVAITWRTYFTRMRCQAKIDVSGLSGFLGGTCHVQPSCCTCATLPRACAVVTEVLEQPILPEEVEIVFCVFDIVYINGHCLTKLPLRLRHEHLAAALTVAPEEGVELEGGKTPTTARLVPIVPHTTGPVVPGCAASADWSVRGSCVQDVVVRTCPLSLVSRVAVCTWRPVCGSGSREAAWDAGSGIALLAS